MTPAPAASGDLVIPPGPGHRSSIVVPAGELVERFSRSSGPGGQSVNTADSRVELRFAALSSPALAAALSDEQRDRLERRLGSRLVGDELVVVASEHRGQRMNRVAARARMTNLLAEALRPPAPTRRATRPSKAARQRRIDAKKQRGRLKQNRGRVGPND